MASVQVERLDHLGIVAGDADQFPPEQLDQLLFYSVVNIRIEIYSFIAG